MNILLVRMCSHISGSEKYNYLLLDHIDRQKFKFYLLTNLSSFAKGVISRGAQATSSTYLGIEVGTKKELFRILFFLPIYLLIFSIQLIKITKRTHIDVYCLQSTTEKIFITPLLKLSGYKVLWIEHGPLFMTSRFLGVKILYRLATKFVDKIIAVSKDTEEDLIKGGVDSLKIVSEPIGVDTSYFAPYKLSERNKILSKLNLISKAKIVTFFGTLNREKGFPEYVKIAEKLKDRKQKVHFLVIGGGPLLRGLHECLKLKKLVSKFTAVGYVDDVRDYLAITDVSIFPTYHNEGLSIALLETLSMGIPTIARDIGGNRELIINNYNGLLIKGGEKDLVDASSRLLADKFLSNKLSINARRHIIANFNIKRRINKFERLFSEI